MTLKFTSSETMEVSKMLLYLFAPYFEEFFTEYPQYSETVEIPAYVEYTAFDAFLKNILSKHTRSEKNADISPIDICNLKAYLLLPLPSLDSLRSIKIENDSMLDRYLVCLRHYGDGDDGTVALLSSLKSSDLSKFTLPPAIKDKCIAMLTPNMIYMIIDMNEYMYIIGWNQLIKIDEKAPSEFGLDALWKQSNNDNTDYYNIKGNIVKSEPYGIILRSYSSSGSVLYKNGKRIMELENERIKAFAVDRDLVAIKGNANIYIYSIGKEQKIASIPSRSGVVQMRFLEDYLYVVDSMDKVRLYSRARDYIEVWSTEVEIDVHLSPSGKTMILDHKAIDVKTKDRVLNDVHFDDVMMYGSSDDELFMIKDNRLLRLDFKCNCWKELIKTSGDIKAAEYLRSPQVPRDQELYNALVRA